jgi:uncharacterized LabA/DUF88 family protein
MERAILFLDYANIHRSACDKGYKLDYRNLLDYIGEGRFMIDAHCYVPIDPRNKYRVDNEIEELWASGYIVNSKVGSIAGDTYKCDFDIEITMDATRSVYTAHPDVIILATGDIDFVPLVLQLRKDGIRVEVASFKDSASRDLILKCSGYISLDVYYLEHFLPSMQATTEGIHMMADCEVSDREGQSLIGENGPSQTPYSSHVTLPK